LSDPRNNLENIAENVKTVAGNVVEDDEETKGFSNKFDAASPGTPHQAEKQATPAA
jgi:hypothetical protein